MNKTIYIIAITILCMLCQCGQRNVNDGNYGDNRFLEEEICVLASNITSDCLRHVETLKKRQTSIYDDD